MRRLPVPVLATLRLITRLPLALGLAVSLGAQDRPLQVRRFTVEDGLAQNAVYRVVQDRAGFLWVGTRRGLQRFDGYSFVPYALLDPQAPGALGSLIADLYFDAHGRMWIMTETGVFRTDSTLRRAVRITSRAGLWSWTPGGELWLLHGDTLLSGTGDDSMRVRHVLRSKGVSVLTVSGQHAWLGIPNEPTATILRLHTGTGDIRTFRAERVTFPTDVTVDSTGRVLVASVDGLEILPSGTAHFRTLTPFSGQRPSLVADGRGGFVVATDAWLARIDERGEITERWSSPEVFGIGAYPQSISLDREGAIWLASLTSGLFRLELQRPPFDYRASRSVPRLPLANDFITALLERQDGALWVGTFRGGVYQISADWTDVRGYRHDARNPASIGGDEIWDIAEDKFGNVWVATAHSICKFVEPGFRCQRVAGIGLGGATLLERDADGFFWMSDGSSRVTSFNPVAGRLSDSIRGLQTVSGRSVISLFHDAGYLWIGKGGLFRTRVANGIASAALDTVHSPTSPLDIYHFLRDRRGRIWVGSDQGLFRLSADSAPNALTPIDVPDVRGTSVFSIAEDRKGRLWLGTAHGLVQYSPEAGTARRYGRRDGFMSGELNRRAALLRRNGELLFGGIEGLTQFDPEFVAGPHGSVPVTLTRWRKVTSKGPTEEWIDQATALRVEPRDRAFTIEFAAMSYAPTVARRYRYRLEPLNPDWIESTDHLATFSAPKPGRYVFRVQTAASPEGEWSTPGSSVVVHVIPPFYATLWFKTLLAFTFMGLLLGAHRLRLRQALATERLRLRISRDLHDEIGAGLSSIALLTDSVGNNGRVSDRERTQLQRIARSAREMVADLRDIVWAIDPDSDKLEDVIARMKDVASVLLPNAQVTFHAPAAAELRAKVGMAARRDLLLLFKELLHNVARHSRAASTTIEIAVHRDHLELIVSDDGVGFEPESVKSGTGIKSLHERAARLGGTLVLSSEPGRGTTARLKLKKT
ncbi:MAG TPA: two-component regulator propeller domain-containing protein [Gemmatimonadaceae bacterium]|nr:two-component regulator propeller domain-containing protein [Gemmatimonadaceae bacterium]